MKRSYWIPGSYAPALSEKHKSFLSLLKNKGFKEESMTKIGLYALGKSTTLESNKSLGDKQFDRGTIDDSHIRCRNVRTESVRSEIHGLEHERRNGEG